MNGTEEPQAIEAEDRARAHWYALVSRLFYAVPDAPLLQGLASAPDEGGDGAQSALIEAWRGLQRACAAADPPALQAEFDDLFVGVGKAPVTPYTASYAASHAPDRHLLALRSRLAEWGLARHERVFESEDHISAVCDAMRWLIEQGRPLEEQRAFFVDFVDPAAALFCSAINRSPLAVFYRATAALALAFVAVEKEAFDMHTQT